MSNLRILSTNIMKSSDVYYSLLNNKQLKVFLFLLLSKPLANIRTGLPHLALLYYINW